MKKVAKFSKVSFEQFVEDCKGILGDVYIENKMEYLSEKYKNINIPKRSTACSAGHDISTPFNIKMTPHQSITIPTGLRCEMDRDYVMLIFARSSLGIKKGMTIANTVPVVDADYAYADNEGHIFICIKNNGEDTLELEEGDKIVQAVFVPFGVADEEEITTERTGGIGSTGK